MAAHTRKTGNPPPRDDEAVPFFDETRVPVEVIELRMLRKPRGSHRKTMRSISHKESYRLAQRPGSYVVIKYRRPVVKIKKPAKRSSARRHPATSSMAAGRT
jgi:transposase